MTSGSERIPVGCGKVRLRIALAALVGGMLGESTFVEGAAMFTWMAITVDMAAAELVESERE